MSQSRQNESNGFTTSIRPLGNGKFGARVYRNGVVIFQDNTARTKVEAARNLKHLLRFVDKCGYDCPMASASRDRFFCGRKSA